MDIKVRNPEALLIEVFRYRDAVNEFIDTTIDAPRMHFKARNLLTATSVANFPGLVDKDAFSFRGQ